MLSAQPPAVAHTPTDNTLSKVGAISPTSYTIIALLLSHGSEQRRLVASLSLSPRQATDDCFAGGISKLSTQISLLRFHPDSGLLMLGIIAVWPRLVQFFFSSFKIILLPSRLVFLFLHLSLSLSSTCCTPSTASIGERSSGGRA